MAMERQDNLNAAARGQMTVELSVLLVFAVAALAFMAFYVQRAMQGSVRNTSQSIGLQFDPRDPYGESQNINLTETTRQQVLWSMMSAAQHKAKTLADSGDPNMVLDSLPTGPLPREPAFQQSAVTANWNSNRSADYDDLR